MSLSGFKLPEAVGFGVLGATIGAEVCILLGGNIADHAGLGLATGAILFVLASQLPILSRRHARAIKPKPNRPAAP
jgi:hypothetical protein